MAFKLVSIGFISGHLDGEAIDFIDVENVLGGVAEEEGAANEKKDGAEAENSRKKTCGNICGAMRRSTAPRLLKRGEI